MSPATTNKLINAELLASGIKNGNTDAFRQFYEMYSRKIYCFSFSYLKSRSEAEEVVQAVFVKIWENRNSIDLSLSLQSYMYKITTNHIYNLFKNKNIHLKVSSESSFHETTDNSTQEQIYYNNLEENIHGLIEQLPEQRKVIFKLSRFHGLSHEEIASKLNLSVRTVESQIYKSLKYLKKNLNTDLPIVLFWILMN